MDKEEQGHWDHVLMVTKLTDEIERLQKQTHYHYENGLKKDVEIERLREELKWKNDHVEQLAKAMHKMVKSVL